MVALIAFWLLSNTGPLNNCDRDISDEPPCTVKGITCGNCEILIYWIEYDSSSNNCIRKSGGGCKSSAPNFQSLEECQNKCVRLK